MFSNKYQNGLRLLLTKINKRTRHKIKKMQNDGDIQLQAAIEQLQNAFEYSKKQRNDEVKIWQKKAEDLENQISFMEQKIQKIEDDKNKAESELGQVLAQNENLKAQNASLMQALQEKEEQINRFLNLNQSLKSLIEQTTYIPQETMKVPVTQYQTEQTTYTMKQAPNPIVAAAPKNAHAEPISPIQKPVQRSTTVTSTTSSRRTASKSSLFIKAAKEELSPSDFSHMISEINMYNRKSQSREETIANVKRLFGAAHRGLFDQFLPMVSGV